MEGRLVPMRAREIEAKLFRLGFIFTHSKRSHRFYLRTGEGKAFRTSISFHPGERSVQTIKDILKEGNISREEWLS